MYKFYKIFRSGARKYCATFDSTLDPDYHSYINWCKENNTGWELLDNNGNIKFSNKTNE
jgi:hypothetical protein